MSPSESGDSFSRRTASFRQAPRAVVATSLSVIATYLGLCVGALCAYSVFFPPITGVQLQREIEAFTSEREYARTYRPVSFDRLPSDLPLAVIAGEDTRFFEHRGLDWSAIRKALQENQSRDRLRGASTITQQLVKNLFLTTHRSYLRKGVEALLALTAEKILSKRRILELYVNVIEWGPATYGIEAAAQYHYGISATRLSRRQAAALAACIPNPRNRTPQTVGRYQQTILYRMNVLEKPSIDIPLSSHAMPFKQKPPLFSGSDVPTRERRPR